MTQQNRNDKGFDKSSVVTFLRSRDSDPRFEDTSIDSYGIPKQKPDALFAVNNI